MPAGRHGHLHDHAAGTLRRGQRGKGIEEPVRGPFARRCPAGVPCRAGVRAGTSLLARLQSGGGWFACAGGGGGLQRTGGIITSLALLLVPATMRLLGHVNWWAPGPLRRLYAHYGIREDAAAFPVEPARAPQTVGGPR
jgi:hypothetical protein